MPIKTSLNAHVIATEIISEDELETTFDTERRYGDELAMIAEAFDADPQELTAMAAAMAFGQLLEQRAWEYIHRIEELKYADSR